MTEVKPGQLWAFSDSEAWMYDVPENGIIIVLEVTCDECVMTYTHWDDGTTYFSQFDLGSFMEPPDNEQFTLLEDVP